MRSELTVSLLLATVLSVVLVNGSVVTARTGECMAAGPPPVQASPTSTTPAEQDDPSLVEESLMILDPPTRQRIQQGLRNEGFDPGEPDGLFGPRTRTAIREWQESRGLMPTSYLDDPQVEFLRAAGVLLPLESETVATVAESSAVPGDPPNCETWNTEEFFATATVSVLTACAAADPDARTSDGHTALHLAAQTTEDPAVIFALLSAGVDVTVRSAAGLTAAQMAAQDNQNPAVVAALVTAEVQAAFSEQQLSSLTPPVGAIVVPRGQLSARNRAPSTFSLSRGDVVANITPSEVYVVRSVTTVPSILFRDRYYLLVEELDGTGPCHDNPCWVYQGSESSDLEPNLIASGR